MISPQFHFHESFHLMCPIRLLCLSVNRVVPFQWNIPEKCQHSAAGTARSSLSVGCCHWSSWTTDLILVLRSNEEKSFCLEVKISLMKACNIHNWVISKKRSLARRGQGEGGTQCMFTCMAEWVFFSGHACGRWVFHHHTLTIIINFGWDKWCYIIYTYLSWGCCCTEGIHWTHKLLAPAMSTVHENTKSSFQAGLITYKGVWMVVCNIVFFYSYS